MTSVWITHFFFVFSGCRSSRPTKTAVRTKPRREEMMRVSQFQVLLFLMLNTCKFLDWSWVRVVWRTWPLPSWQFPIWMTMKHLLWTMTGLVIYTSTPVTPRLLIPHLTRSMYDWHCNSRPIHLWEHTSFTCWFVCAMPPKIYRGPWGP